MIITAKKHPGRVLVKSIFFRGFFKKEDTGMGYNNDSYDDSWMNPFDEEESASSKERGRFCDTGDSGETDEWAELFDGDSEPRRKKPAKKRNWLPVALLVLVACAVLGALLGDDDSSVSDPSGKHLQASFPTYEQPDLPTIPQPTAPQQTLPQQTEHLQTDPVQTVAPSEPVVSQQTVSDVRYFGQKLSADYQKIYSQIVKAVANHDAELSGLVLKNENDVAGIVEAVYWDYGEYFWFSGGYASTYWDRDGYVLLDLKPKYRWDRNTSMQYKAYVENATRDMLARSAGLSEYEKVKAVYDYLVDNTIYDLNYSQKTIYEQFYYGRAVCDAYARSTQYLLNKLGVEVIYVVGDGYSTLSGTWGSHAWNIVKIGGAYYQFDATWGDPVNDDGVQTKRYTYLCVTTEEMARDHRTEWALYPNCTATEYNYYVQAGHYLGSRNTELIKSWMAAGAANGNTFEFKTADRSLYDWVMNDLIGGQQMYDLFEQSIGRIGGYSYSQSELYHTISLTWS